MKFATTYLQAAKNILQSDDSRDGYNMECDLFDKFWIHNDTCNIETDLGSQDPQVIVLYLCLMDTIAKNP